MPVCLFPSQKREDSWGPLGRCSAWSYGGTEFSKSKNVCGSRGTQTLGKCTVKIKYWHSSIQPEMWTICNWGTGTCPEDSVGENIFRNDRAKFRLLADPVPTTAPALAAGQRDCVSKGEGRTVKTKDPKGKKGKDSWRILTRQKLGFRKQEQNEKEALKKSNQQAMGEARMFKSKAAFVSGLGSWYCVLGTMALSVTKLLLEDAKMQRKIPKLMGEYFAEKLPG